MTNDRVRQALVIVATLAVLVVNGLASYLPLNGVTTADVSDAFQVLFVPEGYVFSVWGIIYIGLLAYTIYQALPRKADDPDMRATGWIYIVSCAANAAWLFAWHWSKLGLSVILMLVLLVSLLAIYLVQVIGRRSVSKGKLWCVHIPFGVYLGWITVATIANVQDWLWSMGWGAFGLGPEVWALIMLAVGTLVTALMLRTRRDIAYALVIVWAFAGIAVKQWANSQVVAIVAAVLAVVVAVLIVLWGAMRRGRPEQTGTA
ncbi:MAG: tryptophan-rich sensory protein [Chloroflexi bacterium]|nr:tryptophan-rich sensory protein [Chloroflexota bacterium]